MEKDRISKRKKDYIEIINRFAHQWVKYVFLLISIGLHYCDVQLMMVNLSCYRFFFKMPTNAIVLLIFPL